MSLSIKAFARALAIVAALATPATVMVPGAASAQVAIDFSVNLAPPPLPVYVQPPLPAVGYLWVPGYWSWDADAGDYYWVPGYWTEPPQVGVLWTPGYWGWNDGAYGFHEGYWGPTVGFYGGISYGFGYNGAGFFGGQWSNGAYQYNRSVTNVTNVTNINTTNVYNQPVANSNPARTSFNGGAGGTTATPTPAQVAAANQPHIAPTAAQTQHVRAAQALPGAHFKENQGKPAIAAVPKPGVFKGPGVVAAKAAGPAPKAEPAAGKPAAEKPAAERKAAPEKPAAENKPAPERRSAEKKPAPEKPAPERKPAPEKHAAERKPAPEKPAVERKAAPERPAPAPQRAPAPQAPRPAPHPAPAPAPHPAPAQHPDCKDPKKCH